MPKDKEIVINPARSAEWLRDEIMRFIRSEQPKPWQQCDQYEQQRIINRVESIAGQSAFNIAKAVLEADGESAAATLTGITGDSKKMTGKITFHSELSDDEKISLIDRLGGNVVVVLRDPSEYTNIVHKLTPEPDQKDLPLDQPTAQGPDYRVIADTMIAQNAAAAPDAVDAHVAVEDTEVAAAPGGELIDDEDEDGDQLGAALINIPDPTKKGGKPVVPADADEI